MSRVQTMQVPLQFVGTRHADISIDDNDPLNLLIFHAGEPHAVDAFDGEPLHRLMVTGLERGLRPQNRVLVKVLKEEYVELVGESSARIDTRRLNGILAALSRAGSPTVSSTATTAAEHAEP